MAFTRHTDGSVIYAAHINELQEAIEGRNKTMAYLRDDFISGTTTSGAVGDLGWTFSGGTVGYLAPDAGRLGVLWRPTGATAGTYAVTRLQNITTGPLLPANTFDSTFIFRTRETDADTTIRCGLGANAIDNPPADGIYVERLGADATWFFVTRAAGIQTRLNSGVAVGTSWLKARIRRVNASTIGFTLNANAEQTMTATIPTAALNPFFANSNGAAAASKSLEVDLFDLLVTGLAR